MIKNVALKSNFSSQQVVFEGGKLDKKPVVGKLATDSVSFKGKESSDTSNNLLKNLALALAALVTVGGSSGLSYFLTNKQMQSQLNTVNQELQTLKEAQTQQQAPPQIPAIVTTPSAPIAIAVPSSQQQASSLNIRPFENAFVVEDLSDGRVVKLNGQTQDFLAQSGAKFQKFSPGSNIDFDYLCEKVKPGSDPVSDVENSTRGTGKTAFVCAMPEEINGNVYQATPEQQKEYRNDAVVLQTADGRRVLTYAGDDVIEKTANGNVNQTTAPGVSQQSEQTKDSATVQPSGNQQLTPFANGLNITNPDQ